MKIHYAFLLGATLTFSVAQTKAQVLNKLKNKGDQKAGEAIDKLFSGKDKKKTEQGSTTQGNTNGNTNGNAGGGNTSGGSGNPSNNGGGGLISTPPDVKQNLTDAETSYKAASYGEARYALQQAMLGVELEIGNQILKSLPETITGLTKIEKEDQVTSTGSGWAGLTIQRKYNDNKEKQLTVTIANNAMWMSALNMYFSSGGYAQTTGGEQNWKQTKVKGNRAIIEYDEGSGYKLSVPIGQSSLIVYEGVNFATEPDMMKAAEALDIDGIKKMLGEQ
ncbi:MAG: hypothetical protein JJE09_03285 [Bacteroidia bacterium]|nr:hypothetical protein [Bacteroidia bacterium]